MKNILRRNEEIVVTIDPCGNAQVPPSVWGALGCKAGEQAIFTYEGDGCVMLMKALEPEICEACGAGKETRFYEPLHVFLCPSCAQDIAALFREGSTGGEV